jgi:hypothetical protein
MTQRNTNTGGVLEAMVLPALQRCGYAFDTQVLVVQRCGGGVQKVDAVATSNGEAILVSLKWQQTSGTAEQKVPFEVMCLADVSDRVTRLAPISCWAETAGNSVTTTRRGNCQHT